MRVIIAMLSILAMVMIAMPVSAQDYGDYSERYHHGMNHHGMKYKDGKKRGYMGRGDCEYCMMGYGMGRGMMGYGMKGMKMGYKKYMCAIHNLPEMRAKLNLTDNQVSQLKNQQTQFLKQKYDWKAEISKKMIDLENQLESNAPVTDVRESMEAISQVMVDMKVAGYETAQDMMEVLNPDQKKVWENFCGFQQSGGMTPDMMEDEDN